MSDLFKGLNFAFNKDNKFSMGENQLINLIKEHGGEYAQNVGSTTSYLLSSHNNPTMRVTLATNNNVPIVG